MSELKAFRIDGFSDGQFKTEFFLKIDDDDGKKMGTFAMDCEGVFYYVPGSQIMTEKENDETITTYDGLISFENLKKYLIY